MKGVIRLCYRKIIDINSVKPWDKLVFADSYMEFLMQAQLYNQDKKYHTFAELITNVPGADRLHFLVSASVYGYLQQLDSKMPDITNALGRQFLTFKHFRFEIVNSHIQDKTQHQVALNFFSELLEWRDTIGHQLLLSVPGNTENGEQQTELFTIPPFVSICSLQPAP